MAFRVWSFLAAACLLAAGVAWAPGCGGGSAGYTGNPPGKGPDGGVLHDGSAPRTDAPSLFGGDSGIGLTLTISPQPATLNVTSTTNTLQFTAELSGQPTNASWTVDNAQIGTIDTNGLFTAGTVGGQTTIYAQADGQKAQTTLTVHLSITDNPGNVPPGSQGPLQNADAGASADPSFAWLYPYDKTIFPRGLLPPELQFGGTTPTAVLVQVSSQYLTYEGFYTGAANRVNLTPALWTTITETAGPNDPVTVSITKLSGTQVSGPIKETWTIAQGSLKGTVYYNSYDSQLAGDEGAVLRIRPGATQPDVLVGGTPGSDDETTCNVCHAVSANGSTLTASHYDYNSGASYNLQAIPDGGGAPPVINSATTSIYSFVGLYPDGTKFMSNAAISGYWPPNVPGEEGGPRPSRMYDTATGTMMSVPSWDNAITYAITPVFSQDGKRIAFNHYDTGQSHTLAIMNFDLASTTFSGLEDVANDSTNFLAWPAFLPDSNWVLYHADTAADMATWDEDKADIWIAHIPSKTFVRLNALDGYDAQGNAYLPGGAGYTNLNYEPTVLPVAVGGYYWVVFTSRRTYGNEIPGGDNTTSDPWSNSPRKKLWVAAIDIDNPQMPATSATDISHPAFYLDGQEAASGDMRGFWALNPCAQNGTSCETGDECCTGYCRSSGGATDGGGSGFSCVPAPSGCANEYEHCTTAADCCGASDGYLCLNGYCAAPTPK